MSDFIMVRDKNNQTETETITNIYLVEKLLRAKYVLGETTSSFLINTLNNRIKKHKYEDVVYIGNNMAKESPINGVVDSQAQAKYIAINKINTNAKIKEIEQDTLKDSRYSNHGVGYHLMDFTFDLENIDEIDERDMVRLNYLMKGLQSFTDRLTKSATSSTITVNTLVDKLVQRVDMSNKESIYSTLLFNRYYVLSLLYLLNSGAISAKYIEDWVSSPETKREMLVEKLLTSSETIILNPMKQMLVKHANNVKTTPDVKTAVEDLLNVVLNNVEDNKTKVKENVMAGFGKYNYDSIYSNLKDDTFSYDSDMCQFVFYDKNVAKDFVDTPQYLDDTSLMGYISNGVLKKRHLSISPEVIEELKLSIEEKSLSGYMLINDLLNYKFSDYLKEIFNNKRHINYSPDTINFKYDFKDKVKDQIEKVENVDSFMKNIFMLAYGDETVVTNESMEITSDEFLNFIEFKTSKTLTQLARDLVKRVIGVEELLNDEITNLSDKRVIGKLLLNENVSNTSILNRMSRRDVISLLRSDISISPENIGTKTFRIALAEDGEEEDHHYPNNESEDFDDVSNMHMLDDIGKFLDTNKCMDIIQNIIEEVETHISFDTSIDSIISSYSYYVSKRIQEFDVKKDISKNDSLLIDYNINNIMMSIMLYELLDSYWYYLKYGETVFNRIEDEHVVKYNDKLYSRYINNTFLFFKDTSLSYMNALSRPESPENTKLKHPITKKNMYHHERLPALLQKTFDIGFDGGKEYYDMPDYNFEIIGSPIYDDVMGNIGTNIGPIAATTAIKIPSEVSTISNKIANIYNDKQNEYNMRVDHQNQMNQNINTSYGGSNINTMMTFGGPVPTINKRLSVGELCDKLDGFTKNSDGEYDDISPYAWNIFFINDNQPPVNSDVLPLKAVERVFGDTTSVETVAKKELNQSIYDEDTKETLEYTYSSFQKINFYPDEPKEHMTYDESLEETGITPPMVDPSNITNTQPNETSYRNERKPDQTPVKVDDTLNNTAVVENIVGKARANDFIPDDRYVFEATQTYFTTSDVLVKRINEPCTNYDEAPPDISPSTVNLAGSLSSKCKDYYIGYDEKHWSYVDNRVVFDGELVDYFEEDFENTKNHNYYKIFKRTKDKKAIITAVGKTIMPKQYYRAVPIKSVLDARRYNKEYMPDEFILGSDFFMYSYSDIEPHKPYEIVPYHGAVPIESVLDARKYNKEYMQDEFILGSVSSVYGYSDIEPLKPNNLDLYKSNYLDIFSNYNSPLLNNIDIDTELIYIPVNFEVGEQIRFEYSGIKYVDVRIEGGKDRTGAFLKKDPNTAARITPYKDIDKFVETTSVGGAHVLNEFNEYIQTFPIDTTDDEFEGLVVTNGYVLEKTKKFKPKSVRDVSRVYFIGEKIPTKKYQNLYKQLSDDGLFHPTVSEDYYKFYKLIYFLRHMVFDFPAFLSNIKNTISWEEFMLSKDVSEFNKYEENL